MPIRINLLAEQQAAEEARSRDPVRRAIWGGSIAIGITIFFIIMMAFKVSAQRRKVAAKDAEFKRTEEEAKPIKHEVFLTGLAESRRRSLDRYAANRFLWGTFLDRLAEVTVDEVRIMDLKATQTYRVITNTEPLFKTNVTVAWWPPPPLWIPWTPKAKPSPFTLASNEFTLVTNLAGQFRTNFLIYKINLSMLENGTNTSKKTNLPGFHKVYTAQVKSEFMTQPFCREEMSIHIEGRDYTTQRAYERLKDQLRQSSYFQSLAATNRPDAIVLFAENQPRPPDFSDTFRPDSEYVKFDLDLYFNGRVLQNE